MRVIYADPALNNETGHHANFCRSIVSELESRRIGCVVLASAHATPILRAELNAIPFFRAYTYSETDHDPVCGWLNGYVSAYSSTQVDLTRLYDVQPTDILYWSCALAPQLVALGEWLSNVGSSRSPRCIAELASGPGVAARWDSEGMSLRFPDPRREHRPVLFKFAAARLRELKPLLLRLFTFDSICSEIYAGLLSRDVATVPWPISSACKGIRRIPADLVTISALGHQKLDKGYHLLPAICRSLLSLHTGIRIIVHNAEQMDSELLDPTLMSAREALEDLAKSENRLILDNRAIDADGWRQLLISSDLVLCPYDPETYATRHSGIIAEALAEGIPMVLPAETIPAKIVAAYGMPGVTFSSFDPQPICEAVGHALNNLESLSVRARSAAAQWSTMNGPAATVDRLLHLASAMEDCRSSPRATA